MSDSNLSYVSTIVLTNGLNSAGPTTTRQPGLNNNNNNNNSASLTSVATTASIPGSGGPGVPGGGWTGGPGAERSQSVSIVGLDNPSYSFQNLRGFTDNNNYNNYDERAPDTQSRELIIDPSASFQSTSSSLKDWSWGQVAWNVIACLLCPGFVYCTVPALLCSIFAYVDHMNKDFEGKRKKLQCAIGWSLTAFVAGIITVFIVLIVLFVAYDASDWNTIPTVPGSDFLM